MSGNRFLVLDETGTVVNVVVGFVDLPAAGFIEQTDDLLHVGIGCVYDAITDSFVNPNPYLPSGEDV